MGISIRVKRFNMKLVRLQKFIAESGFSSRRKAEDLIARGDVHVNDQLVTKLGVKINPDQDQVKIRGKLLSVSQKSYYIFYKPKGVVSTIKDTHGRKSVFDYVKGLPERVYPVGRLDFHSEGLMIL